MGDIRRILYKIVALGLLIAVTFAFWGVAAESLRLWGYRVNVMPFLVAAGSIFFRKEWGAGLGCFIGILCDAANGKTAGYYTVMYMLLAILVGLIAERYYRTRFVPVLLSGYGIYLVSCLVRLLLDLVIPGQEEFSLFFTYFVPAGLYSALWFLPLFPVINHIYHRAED